MDLLASCLGLFYVHRQLGLSVDECNFVKFQGFSRTMKIPDWMQVKNERSVVMTLQKNKSFLILLLATVAVLFLIPIVLFGSDAENNDVNMEDSCNYPETSVSTVAKEMVTNEYVAQCYYPETLMTVAVEENIHPILTNIHPTASDRWFYPEVWVRSADTEDFARGESYTRYDFPSWGFSIAIPESFGTYHIRKIRFAYIDNPDEFWEHSISLVTHNGSLFNFYRTPLENVSNHPNFCPVRRVINIAETDAYQYRVGISPCSGGIMAGVN